MEKPDDSSDEGKQAVRDFNEMLRSGGVDGTTDARIAVDDVRDAATDVAHAPRVTGARVKDEARAAAASATVVLGDTVENAAEVARPIAEEQGDVLAVWKERAQDYLRENPLPAVAIAAAAGLVIGLLLKGRGR